MPEREAGSDGWGKAGEVTAHPLPDRLQRLEAGGALRRVNADALGRAMVDGDKDRDLAFARDRAGQVGAPHRVHRLRDDGAVVTARAPGCTDTGRGEQIVLAHEAQHPTTGRAKARHAQPSPDFPVTLAMKGAGGQDRADPLNERSIRHRPDRTRTPGRLCAGWGKMPVERGPRHAPDPAHTGQAIGPAAHGRGGPAHGRDPRARKGRFASRAVILASSSSRSRSISPSLALRRLVSISAPWVGRVARLASPAARKASGLALRVAAVTPSARETVSRSSPRSRRRTASRLRWRDMRPPRPRPTCPAAVVCLVIITLLRIMSA